MDKKLGVVFRKFCNIIPIKGYKDDSLNVGSSVIVETDRGVEFGRIVSMTGEKGRIAGTDIKLRKILRYATEEDIQKARSLEQKEKEAIDLARKKIGESESPIRIIEAEMLFDESKVIYYYKVLDVKKVFSNKQLIKDLSSALNKKIDMHSVSPREQARIVPGIGPCGRKVCCASFLDEFPHISVKMLKEQGIALNQSKICGLCGKFLCCLKYECECKK